MRRQRGETLIGLLVVVAIIAILAVVLLKGGNFSGTSPRADGRGKTMPDLAKAKTEDEVCRSNLGQVRSGLLIAKDPVEDKWPDTIEATRLGAQFYACPMGKQPYEYNPETGEVKCPYPGHEKF